MTRRARLALAAATILVPVALAPLLLRPTYVLILAGALAAVALAARSIAYPVALAGLPAVAVGLLGTNPFPPGGIAKLTALWIALAIAIAVLRSERELPLAILMTPVFATTVVLAVWLLARLGSSLDPAYGSRKVQLFFALNVVGLVGGTLIGRRSARVELWVLLQLLVSTLSAFVLFRNLLSGHAVSSVGGRFSLTDAGSPIGLSREAALGLLLAVYTLLISRSPGRQLVAVCSIPLLAVAFAAGGSRGPVLGLVLGLLILFVLVLRDAAARRRLVLVVVGGVTAAVLVPQLVPGQDVGRTLSILTGSEGGLSSNGRSELWSRAWSAFANHPLFGAGTGSFHAAAQLEFYPHNILLESAAEWGIVGVVLVGVLLWSAASRLARLFHAVAAPERAQTALAAALLAAALANALFSGDVTDNADVWFASGLAMGLSMRAGRPAIESP